MKIFLFTKYFCEDFFTIFSQISFVFHVCEINLYCEMFSEILLIANYFILQFWCTEKNCKFFIKNFFFQKLTEFNRLFFKYKKIVKIIFLIFFEFFFRTILFTKFFFYKLFFGENYFRKHIFLVTLFGKFSFHEKNVANFMRFRRKCLEKQTHVDNFSLKKKIQNRIYLPFLYLLMS